MDGQRDRRTDRWTDKQRNGQMEGNVKDWQTDRGTNGQTPQTKRRTDKWTDGPTDRQKENKEKQTYRHAGMQTGGKRSDRLIMINGNYLNCDRRILLTEAPSEQFTNDLL